MANMHLTDTVGRNGKNGGSDVEKVQTLLNKAGAQLRVDRDCGRKTIASICDVQRQFLAQPDGLITPGGPTYLKLTSGTVKIKNAWKLLPADPHHTTYCHPSEDIRDRQWGTPKTIAAIQEICRTFFLEHAIKLQIGDISLAQGGPMNGHTSGHRIGKNVDIRPIHKQRLPVPLTVTDPNYDKEKALALAKIIEGLANVRKVLFGDAYVIDNTGPKTELEATKHHNHLHVEMFE
jgi:hypothetical protein